MTDWNYYAQTYDLMAAVTPAYRDLLTRFNNEASRWPLGDGATLLEVGAGTGNFALAAAALHPKVEVIHSEPEAGMQRRAIEKASREGRSNVRFLCARADELAFRDNELDAAVLVHVLYTLPNPQLFLRRVFEWLRPGAFIFACDLGRVMNIPDWRSYLWRELVREHGYLSALMTMWHARGVFRANEKIAQAQLSGQYWTHSGEEFEEVFRSIGFLIERKETVYRGYSDLLVARKLA